MSSPEPPQVTLLTLNCWGLKHLSALRQPRLAEIGRRLTLTSPQPDIVALQECWTQEDYLAIRSATSTILPHGKYYHSGVFGSGLAILSRWPLEQSSIVRYPLNGRPTAFYRGDWFVGKGVACATIRVGGGDVVLEVFNTHTHASYGDGSDDSYVAHQTAQAWEMAKLLRAAHERGHLVVGLGDFNMVPGSILHKLIEAHAPVRDVWRVVHPDSSLGTVYDAAERARGRPVPTAEENLRENGVTSGSVYSTWRWEKKERKRLGPGKEEVVVEPDTLDPLGKRLDYIFAGDGTRSKSGAWAVKDVAVCMTERHPDLGCSLSDHFGVVATLEFRATSVKEHEGDNELRKDAATGSSEAYSRRRRERDQSSLTITNEEEEEALQNGAFLRLQSPAASLKSGWTKVEHALAGSDGDGSGLPVSTYDDILAIINKYVAREHTQQRWRGIHFFASVAVTIGCLTAVWFSPRNFVAFLLVLLSSLGLVAGTIDGLIALLFVNTELRALKEFEWEISNARAAAAERCLPDIFAMSKDH